MTFEPLHCAFTRTEHILYHIFLFLSTLNALEVLVLEGFSVKVFLWIVTTVYIQKSTSFYCIYGEFKMYQAFLCFLMKAEIMRLTLLWEGI